MLRTSLAVLVGALQLVALSGCELIVAVDRNQIPEGGAGGMGGMGGMGGGGTGGTAGMGGGGTGGMEPECTTPADCAAPASECQDATCEGGVCGLANKAAGTPLGTQTPGDCQAAVCDGSGSPTTQADDTDLPNDNNDCTVDACDLGVPTFDDAALDTPCGAGGTLFCDGAGECVGCIDASDCGASTACVTQTCTAGACGQELEPVGTVVQAQSAGDCKQNQCDALGNVIAVNDNADVFVDGNACTNDVCTAGTPSNPDSPLDQVCSGGFCDGAGTCVECNDDAQCASGVCTSNVCAAPNCTDTVKNGTESDTDCGGSCPADCADGKACGTAADCASGVCASNVCAAPSCGDTVKNGFETDIDCGGSCPADCADGKACSVGGDCASGVCTGNLCAAPSCGDTVKNGTETDIDCGGSCPADCDPGEGCSVGGDCTSGVCTGNLCAAPSCSDTVKNGTETDIDCGGSCALKCAPGQTCNGNDDCTSGVCTGNLCAAQT